VSDELERLRRRTNPEMPAAVVMGLSTAALAVARSLGRRGVPMVGVHHGERPPPASACRYLHAVRAPDIEDGPALLEFYLRLGERLGHQPVLMPTGDQNVLFIVRHREALSRRFRTLLGDSRLLERIASKATFLDLCREHDLPIPPTAVPESETELEQLVPRLRFPCVVKPEFTHLWRTPAAAAAGLGRAKALPVADPEALMACYRRVAAVTPRVIVQEMIVGPDANHESYCALTDTDGRRLGEFVARKLRVAPAHFGMGCLVESVRTPDVIAEGRRVLEALQLHGFAGVQFKRDQRDGRVSLIEMTIRFPVWAALPPASGVDFPFMFYRLCAGQPVSPAGAPRTGTLWLDSRADLLAMPNYLSDGSWTRWAYHRSRLRADVSAHFAWDDPAPWLRQAAPVWRAAARAYVNQRPPASPEERPLLVVTVDTEADDAWGRPERISLHNLAELPRFQALCERYGAVPTYLATYECATRDEAVAVLAPLARAERCEIGHHLHVWTTPPFAREHPAGIDADWLPAYQSELPQGLFRDKADHLHEAIRDAFGRAPTAHRAGRWGVDQRTIDWLTQRGYVVDTSVTPLTNWRHSRGRGTGGPSFARCPTAPYFWPSSADSGRAERGVVEIPVTVCWRGGPRAATVYGRLVDAPGAGPELARRAFGRLLEPGLLRPNPAYPLEFFRRAIAQAASRPVPMVNLMLHSSELAYGCSPSTRTRADLRRVWERLELVLRLAQEQGFQGIGLTDAARALPLAAGASSRSSTEPEAAPAGRASWRW
jgi:predicted ATP-grasp superfamily ATP-dependent carboligase